MDESSLGMYIVNMCYKRIGYRFVNSNHIWSIDFRPFPSARLHTVCFRFSASTNCLISVDMDFSHEIFRSCCMKYDASSFYFVVVVVVGGDGGIVVCFDWVFWF